MKDLIEQIIKAFGYTANGETRVRAHEDQIVITINHEHQLIFNNRFYSGWMVTTEAIEDSHCDIEMAILLSQVMGRCGYLVENCQRVRELYEQPTTLAEAA